MNFKAASRFIGFILLSIIMASGWVESSENTAAASKYTIKATLQLKKGRASGEVMIHWQNNSSSILKEIPFAFLNPGQEKNLVKGCEIDGQKAKFICQPEEDEEGITRLEIFPPAPIEPGQKHIIKINFTSGKVRKAYGFLHYTMGWLPMALVVYDGKPRLRMQALSDWEVTTTFPSGYQAAFSGMIVSEEEKDGEITIKTKATDISNYGILLFKDFIVEEAELEGVKIRNFYFKGDEKWSRKLFEMAKDVISFYKEIIGFYPQPVLSMLPGYPNRPAGGYPICANCIVIHRGLDLLGAKAENFANWITAHEIGHQYWGYGYVLEDTDYPRWFGLSMGIYTDRLYSRAKELGSSFYENLKDRYLAGVLANIDTTILQKVSELDKKEFDWNNVIAHGKSYTVLTMLEQIVGEETFFEIFKSCLKQYKGKNVTLEMFKETCEAISGKDLAWFFHQWYQTPAVLDYRIMDVRTSKEGEAYITECAIERKGDAVMPVDVVLRCTDGKSLTKTIDGWDKRKLLKFRTKSAPLRFILDPEEKLPLLGKAQKSITAITVAARQLHYMRKNGDALSLLQSAYDLGKNVPEYLYRLGQEYRYVGDFQTAIETLKKVVEMEKGEYLDIYYKPISVLNIGIAYDQMGKRKEAEAWYKKAQNYPSPEQSAKKYLKTPYSNR